MDILWILLGVWVGIELNYLIFLIEKKPYSFLSYLIKKDQEIVENEKNKKV